MITITVTSQLLAEKAEKFMSEEAMHNPNVGNTRYAIEMGDFDEIDWPEDEITACQIFSQIFRDELDD